MHLPFVNNDRCLGRRDHDGEKATLMVGRRRRWIAHANVTVDAVSLRNVGIDSDIEGGMGDPPPAPSHHQRRLFPIMITPSQTTVVIYKRAGAFKPCPNSMRRGFELKGGS